MKLLNFFSNNSLTKTKVTYPFWAIQITKTRSARLCAPITEKAGSVCTCSFRDQFFFSFSSTSSLTVYDGKVHSDRGVQPVCMYIHGVGLILFIHLHLTQTTEIIGANARRWFVQFTWKFCRENQVYKVDGKKLK